MTTLPSVAVDESLAVLRRELSAAVGDLTSEQTQMRPRNRPAAWTIQQIVEHLLLSYEGTRRVLDERLEKGTATKKPATLLQRCAQMVVTGLGYFPHGRKAPAPVQPATDATPRSGRELADAVDDELEALERLSVECERVLGRGRSVTHISLGPMSMQQWRRFQLVHGRHHLRQIKAIRSEHHF